MLNLDMCAWSVYVY